MGLKLVSASATNPVTLAEAKAHLRVETSDEDTLISALVAAATDWAEGFLGRALVDQTWDLYLDEFPDSDGEIKIPLPPLIEVLGVYYLGSAGPELTLDPSGYVVDAYSDPGRVLLTAGGTAWPIPQEIANAVRVRFRAGYLDTSVSPAEDRVPATIKAAILLMIGDLYANREETAAGNIGTASFTVERLLRLYRFNLSLA